MAIMIVLVGMMIVTKMEMMVMVMVVVTMGNLW